MKSNRTLYLLLVLRFATTQRLTSVTFNTQTNTVRPYQKGVKVDKPYFTFELMSCSSEAGIVVNDIYFAFHPATSKFATNVNGYHEVISINLGLNCSSYKKFKLSWINGNLCIWHIVSSQWQILKSSNGLHQVQFSNIDCYSRNLFAEWRVFYYDESPAKPVSESCIKI